VPHPEQQAGGLPVAASQCRLPTVGRLSPAVAGLEARSRAPYGAETANSEGPVRFPGRAFTVASRRRRGGLHNRGQVISCRP